MRTALTLLLLASTAAPAAAAEREFFGFDTFPVTPQTRVVVATEDVAIHVRGADIPVVRLSTDLRIAGLGADRADAWLDGRMPRVTTAPERLSISSAPEGEGFLGLGSLLQRARLGVVLPMTAVPDLTTGSAPIQVHGTFPEADPVRLRTGSGTVEFTGSATSFEVRSTSGDSALDLLTPADRLWARTSAGSLELSGGARSVQVETASGRVELRGLLGPASVETVDGAVVLTWDVLPADASIRVISSRGDIRLRIPADASPSGRLSTSTGSIRSGFPGTVNDEGNAVLLAGTGPRLEVETASGDIVLEQDPGWFAPERAEPANG